MRIVIGRSAGSVSCGIALAVFVAGVGSKDFASGQTVPPTASAMVMPRYDATRNLLLPTDYRQWVLVGSSLGLTYAEPGRDAHQMFNATLMEPSAYRYFVQTGTFREGTMLALVNQGIGTNTVPARTGQFAADVHTVEMAVKDSKRLAEGWAYYRFNGPMMGGYRTSAAPEAKATCYSCHDTHAAQDNVFTQFYGLLTEAAADRK